MNKKELKKMANKIFAEYDKDYSGALDEKEFYLAVSKVFSLLG